MLVRKLIESDLDDLYKITSNSEIMSHIGNGRPWSLNKTLEFIRWNIKDPKDDNYGVINDRNKLIGIVGTKIYKYCKNVMYGKRAITIFIGEQGKGYGTAAIKFILSKHPKEELFASIDKNNEPSRKLFLKCGFRDVDFVEIPGHGYVYIMSSVPRINLG